MFIEFGRINYLFNLLNFTISFIIYRSIIINFSFQNQFPILHFMNVTLTKSHQIKRILKNLEKYVYLYIQYNKTYMFTEFRRINYQFLISKPISCH